MTKEDRRISGNSHIGAYQHQAPTSLQKLFFQMDAVRAYLELVDIGNTLLYVYGEKEGARQFAIIVDDVLKNMEYNAKLIGLHEKNFP